MLYIYTHYALDKYLKNEYIQHVLSVITPEYFKKMHPLVTIIARFISFLLVSASLGAIFIAMVFVSLFLYLAPDMPAINNLSKYEFNVPLRVFSAERELIAEYGAQRRNPVSFKDIPVKLRNAFISAEDHRFYEHPGVDAKGVIRAALKLARTGKKAEGASTITMQLARNLWGKKQKTFKRKLIEVFVAFKIEAELSKEKILELYLNKIFLGKRSYGVQAAAHVYYGKNLKDLTIAQMAMIAGLPKAPSTFNPIINPKRALTRRAYVLGSMVKLGHITKAEYEVANKEQLSSIEHKANTAVSAPYVAEMVRAQIINKYGSNAYENGYNVYTTIRAKHQKAANKALRTALLAYDRRHGYRPSLARDLLKTDKTDAEKDKILKIYKDRGGLVAGMVLEVMDKSAKIYLGDGLEVFIDWKGLKWARKYISDTRVGPAIKKASDTLRRGDVVYVESMPKGKWSLAQVPKVSGALVAIDPKDGAVTALVGGFDFNDAANKGKFNRVMLARRQPGSNFKPFLYSAALAKGYTPATLINDAPVVFKSEHLEKDWKPDNSGKKLHGPIRMRLALAKSLNLVAIRLLQYVTIPSFIEYAQKFGFPKASMPPNLSLSLGSGEVTPYRLAAAYAIFANGGYRVSPYFITRIEQRGKGVLYRAEPAVACSKCERNPKKYPDINAAKRVMDAGVNYQINSMLRGVVQIGTARRASREIKRRDMAGKTGTTNDQVDAWFSGYTSHLVTTVWVGFDNNHSLGRREYGGVAALPAWIHFMKEVMKGKKQILPRLPRGMVSVKINKTDGLLAGGNSKGSMFETFRVKYVPKRYSSGTAGSGGDTKTGEDGEIF